MMTNALREPIAESWRRAQLAGLEPSSALNGISHAKVDDSSVLLSAAAPVLDELNANLGDTMFTTMLVDRDGRVAQRYCGDTRTARAFDDLGIDVGASLLEEVVGTNAPGTVLETRQSISIHGGEHFATQFKAFSCHGRPIIHPTTRRIEGVLDLTAMLEDASPLLPPLVARAVADIENRLLDRSRVSEKELLAAFQAAAGRHRPLVAVGRDMVMSNQPAMDMLGSTDLALLRMFAADARDGANVTLTLESGTRATVRATRVGGQRGGALLHVEAQAAPRTGGGERRASTAPVLVSGPPGSGRTTRAREVASAQPVTILTAASALLDGTEEWAQNFGALVRGGQGAVCVDGVELLPDALVELVASHMETPRPPQVILVSGPVDSLEGRAAALVSRCTERHTLDPLANRLHQLPDLTSCMLRDAEADEGLHFTPGALRALATQPWPGNLRELRAVLDHVMRQRTTGGVTIDDLPGAYRAAAPTRPMARIERAERDAIVAALRQHEGNKVRAAAELGISRTTLYSKMRALRVTGY